MFLEELEMKRGQKDGKMASDITPDMVESLDDAGKAMFADAYTKAMNENKTPEECFKDGCAAIVNKYDIVEDKLVKIKNADSERKQGDMKQTDGTDGKEYAEKVTDWQTIFKTGMHTDNNGQTRYWSEDDLKTTAAKFNPSNHTPPLTIGHPSTNGPAFGWVAGLRVNGKNLQAKFKAVTDGVKDLVQKGLYQKISSAFYGDKSLRHVGLLGADVPAVKGLPALQFSESNDYRIYESLADGSPSTFLSPQSLQAIQPIQLNADKLNKGENMKGQEYAEMQNKINKLQQYINAVELQKWGNSIGVTPAMEQSGIYSFMEMLPVSNFSEGDNKTNAISMLDWFKAFVEKHSQRVEFNEITANESRRLNSHNDLASKAEAYARENKIAFGDAVRAISNKFSNISL